jgi:hypothetical protein
MAKRKPEITGSENLLAAKSLQQIASCLAYLAVHTERLEKRPQIELVKILMSWGFDDRNVIASVLDTTPETISVRQSELKKAEAEAKKAKKRGSEAGSQHLEALEARAEPK